MIISTIIERDHLTLVEWKDKVVVTGKSPRVPEFVDYLDNQFIFPVADGEGSDRTTSYTTESREVANDFELANAVLKMARELQLNVEITEEI